MTSAAEPVSPSFTVIVPAFNAGRHLAACLGSVKVQSLTDWECLVVDDGSTDDTAALTIAQADPRIHLIRQANAGVSAARDRGLAEARGGAVLFLDADDLLHPTALERLDEGLKGSPNAVAAYGPFRKILSDGTPYPGEKPLSALRYPSGDVLEPMLRQNFLANGGHVLIRRFAASAAGGFERDLRLSEDWEFWCRLALEGPFAYIGSEAEVMYFRVDPGSSSGSLARHWDNHIPAISAVLTNPAIRGRFAALRWAKLARQIDASHRWEAGRVNFTERNFVEARRLMVQALLAAPSFKRLAMFAVAQASQLTGRSLLSRLRFRDQDQIAG